MEQHYEIIEVNKLDPILMDKLFDFLKADCNAYANLDRRIFDECDIYVYTSKKDLVEDARGIIGIRRTTMDNINVHKLEYYCQPNNVLYSIEFLHVFDMYAYNVKKNILLEMVGASVKDKNDGFTFFVPKCPINNSEPMYHALIDNNFKLYPYLQNGSAVVMFMRSPKTGKNLDYKQI